MKPHIIRVEELTEMIVTHETLLAAAPRVDGGSKSIKCSLNGTYRTRDGETIVYEGVQIFDAAEAYNDLYRHHEI